MTALVNVTAGVTAFVLAGTAAGCDARVGRDPLDAAAPVTDAVVTESGPVVHPPAPTAVHCADPSLVALRTGRGVSDVECVKLGAKRAADTTPWPDPTGLPLPWYFVLAGAPAGGDGSREHPFGRIADAVSATVPPGTVVLSSGRHTVDAPVHLHTSYTLLGAGAIDGTVLVAMHPIEVVRVDEPFTAVTVSRLAVHFEAAARDATSATGFAVRTGAGLALDEVAVDGADIGIDVTSATVTARAVTVTGALRYGVHAIYDARVVMDDFVVRDGLAQGVRIDNSHARLARGLVASNVRHGIVFVNTESGTQGWADCLAGTAGGALSCVVRVVSERNGVAGLLADGLMEVQGYRLTVSDTQLGAVSGGSAGDGIACGGPSTIKLDPDVTLPEQQGFGSAIVGNARAGILAQGAGAVLTVRGAVVAGNAGGGVFVAQNARVDLVGESVIAGNGFAGIVAAPSAQVGIVQCNGIVDTYEASVMTTSGFVTLADAVHLNQVTGATLLRSNVIARNDRFGLLVNAASATLEASTGGDNRYGVGVYGGATVEGDRGSITGRGEALPVSPTLVQGL